MENLGFVKNTFGENIEMEYCREQQIKFKKWSLYPWLHITKMLKY